MSTINDDIRKLIVGVRKITKKDIDLIVMNIPTQYDLNKDVDWDKNFKYDLTPVIVDGKSRHDVSFYQFNSDRVLEPVLRCKFKHLN